MNTGADSLRGHKWPCQRAAAGHSRKASERLPLAESLHAIIGRKEELNSLTH